MDRLLERMQICMSHVQDRFVCIHGGFILLRTMSSALKKAVASALSFASGRCR